MEDKSKLQKNSGIRSHRNHGTRDLARISFPWLAVAPREFSVPLADHPHFTSVLLGSATTTSLGHELLRQPKLSSIMGNVRRQIVVRSNASGSRKRRDDAMHATAKKKPSGAAQRDGSTLLCLATLAESVKWEPPEPSQYCSSPFQGSGGTSTSTPDRSPSDCPAWVNPKAFDERTPGTFLSGSSPNIPSKLSVPCLSEGCQRLDFLFAVADLLDLSKASPDILLCSPTWCPCIFLTCILLPLEIPWFALRLRYSSAAPHSR